MKIFRDKAWQRSLAGLSVNISAAFFVAPFIGVNFSLLNLPVWFLYLFADFGAGIIFLWISVLSDRRIKK